MKRYGGFSRKMNDKLRNVFYLIASTYLACSVMKPNNVMTQFLQTTEYNTN